MKKKQAKKYFKLDNVFVPSNLSNISLSEIKFNEKKSNISKKYDISKEILENIFYDLSSFDLVLLYEIIDFNSDSEYTKTFLLLLNNDVINQFSDNVIIANEDVFENQFQKSIALYYNSLSSDKKAKFNSIFNHDIEEISDTSFANINSLKELFSEEAAIFLLMMDAVLDDNFAKIGSYYFSNKENEKCPYLIEDFNIYCNVNFNIDNVLLPNGKRYSKKEWKNLRKELQC